MNEILTQQWMVISVGIGLLIVIFTLGFIIGVFYTAKQLAEIKNKL